MTEEKKDRRLILEEHRIISPTLAQVLGGDTEASILQQIHYWLTIAAENGSNFKDGYYWTYNSVRKWQEQFPYLTEGRVGRILKKLEEQKILITANYNKLPIDRTKWYRIDYEALQTLIESRFCKNEKWDFAKMKNAFCTGEEPLPNTSPYNSLPNNSKEKNLNRAQQVERQSTISFSSFLKLKTIKERNQRVLKAYIKEYERRRKETHPALREEKWQEFAERLFYLEDDLGREIDLEEDDLIAMIKPYFNKTYWTDTNYRLGHFSSNGVRKILYYELIRDGHTTGERGYFKNDKTIR